MTTVFVNSGAGGANNGTSWTDAYTSLASTNGAAAGDTVKVHKTHSETTLASDINWSNGTVANPVRIVCVDKDASDAIATGALVAWNTSTLGPKGNIYAYGIKWSSSGSGLGLSPPNDGFQTHEQCTLATTGSLGRIDLGNIGSALRHTVWLINTTVDLSGAGSSGCGVTIDGVNLRWHGGSYVCLSGQGDLFTATVLGESHIEGVSFSGAVTNLFTGSSVATGFLRIRRCVPPTYTNVFGTEPNGYGCRMELDGFVSGTLTTAALPPTNHQNRNGTVKALTSRYRTGGADDGSQANAYSWELASNANAAAFVSALPSPPITRWVSTGSQTVTVYVASGVTLKDDEFWIEVLSPSEAGSATAQAKFQSTRAAPLATAANLTTDGTSTWNGTGVGTKQKCSVSINPTVPGPVAVRVHLAKASTTVYVDPKLDVA